MALKSSQIQQKIAETSEMLYETTIPRHTVYSYIRNAKKKENESFTDVNVHYSLKEAVLEKSVPRL